MIDKKESIIKQLTQKPWESAQVKVDNLHEGKTFNLHVGKLGLRYIMVVSTIMFCLFIVTYSDRMVYDDWVRMPEPFLLWINTLILFISSFVFIRIQLAAKKNQFEKTRRDLILIGILALAFLIGQLLVWQNLVEAGYYVSGSPANGYFYLFTALHGIHLLGGLIYWAMTIKKVWNINNIVIRKAKHTTELCAIYWHFLLAVWVVLFGLMLFS
ncbi:MAG: putative cytochrome c oxidase subunit 3 [Alphaproteobacteria bacterium MarineAlpha5_Bin5]|nr:MAG: putative cytochrome c oxidase subunit 3 [Alphaproteobacteria bacterium MarineAlpha5_Bin5]PPR51680.1 MAG: putative cytochrome c oxidase subunit 3 [Alphaproteobacteria bacterium MarineAlpha5_Bin4]|tara:strand:+ start:3047 stop:3685 length:639 start_codon:yes stop_codon:yes gene_type:complete